MVRQEGETEGGESSSTLGGEEMRGMEVSSREMMRREAVHIRREGIRTLGSSLGALVVGLLEMVGLL